MNIHNFSYIFFFSVIAPSLYAMEQGACYKNMIPHVTQPKGIGVVRNNVIAVLEPHSFAVFDLAVRQYIIKKENAAENMYDFAIDKQGEKVALSSASGLTVYNAKTGEQEWKKDISVFYFLPIAFNNLGEIVSYDKFSDRCTIYTQDKIKIIAFPESMVCSNSLFAHHPTETKILYQLNDFMCGTNNYVSKENAIFSVAGERGHNVIGQQYNYDGSTMVCMKRGPRASSVTAIGKMSKFSRTLNKFYVAMFSHSNKNSIFLLSNKNTIELWNWKLQQHLGIATITNEEDIPLRSRLEKRLALSPNGRCLYVALKNKCVMVPLSIEFLCGSEAKQDIIFRVCALLPFINVENANNAFPQEINYVIMKKLLKLYEK